MRVGVPKETVAGERRVALVPEVVGRLVKAGHEVVVEGDAGVEAGFPNDAYTAVGASLGDAWAADVVCKAQKPAPPEAGKCGEPPPRVGCLRGGPKPGPGGRRPPRGGPPLLPRGSPPSHPRP